MRASKLATAEEGYWQDKVSFPLAKFSNSRCKSADSEESDAVSRAENEGASSNVIDRTNSDRSSL